jgi:hypothetical protein
MKLGVRIRGDNDIPNRKLPRFDLVNFRILLRKRLGQDT